MGHVAFLSQCEIVVTLLSALLKNRKCIRLLHGIGKNYLKNSNGFAFSKPKALHLCQSLNNHDKLLIIIKKFKLLIFRFRVKKRKKWNSKIIKWNLCWTLYQNWLKKIEFGTNGLWTKLSIHVFFVIFCVHCTVFIVLIAIMCQFY
jgi:hypothetical protein